MRFSVDTNVLVYAINVDDPVRHDRAQRLLDRAAKADCVIALQALAELFNVLVRKRRIPVASARATVMALRKDFPVVTAEETTLAEAMEAVEIHQLSFWDAMLWATVRAAGCEVFLTEDLQDGRKLGGVTFVNPFDAANAGRVDALLSG